jgi:hypothetical protein
MSCIGAGVEGSALGSGVGFVGSIAGAGVLGAGAGLLAAGAAEGDASGPLPMGGSVVSRSLGSAGVGVAALTGTTRVIGSESCANTPFHCAPKSTASV